MRICSWNILYENKQLGDALDFIRASDFDIWCLQEVPDEFLTLLQNLPYHMASAVEYNYTKRDGIPRQTLSVILSRYPISEYGDVFVPNWFEHPIARERLISWFLRFVRVWDWTKTSGGRNHLRALIDVPGVGITQVYSIHLTIHGPKARRQELTALFGSFDATLPALVCGDLNIFDGYLTSLPSWFFGATLVDALMPWRERRDAEALFTHHELTNPLRKQITHLSTWAQLDHILPSSHFVVRRATVVRKCYGSDHNPVLLECA